MRVSFLSLRLANCFALLLRVCQQLPVRHVTAHCYPCSRLIGPVEIAVARAATSLCLCWRRTVTSHIRPQLVCLAYLAIAARLPTRRLCSTCATVWPILQRDCQTKSIFISPEISRRHLQTRGKKEKKVQLNELRSLQPLAKFGKERTLNASTCLFRIFPSKIGFLLESSRPSGQAT